MDRNQAKEFYPVLQAFAKGESIECRTKPSAVEGSDIPNNWTEMNFGIIQSIASSQNQSTVLSRMQKSAGQKCSNTSHSGG